MTRTVPAASPKVALRRRLALSTALGASLIAVGVHAQETKTPVGPSVQSGAVTFQNGVVPVPAAAVNGNATNLNVNVFTAKSIINWQSFDVDTGARVNFNNFAGRDAAVLNRVTTGDVSQIAGRLTAPDNLAVWLINPNGIMVGQGANINVGSFIASTLPITSDADFLNTDSVRFQGAPGAAGKIFTDGAGAPGSITTTGGVLALIAPQIDLNANLNSGEHATAFVMATDVSVTTSIGGPLSITVNAGTAVGAQTIKGAIVADRMYALLTPQDAVDALLDMGGATVTNATVNPEGVVVLGTGGTTQLGGTTLTNGANTTGSTSVQLGAVNLKRSVGGGTPGNTSDLLVLARANATAGGDITLGGVTIGDELNLSAASGYTPTRGTVAATGPISAGSIALTGANISLGSGGAARAVSSLGDLVLDAVAGAVTLGDGVTLTGNAANQAGRIMQIGGEGTTGLQLGASTIRAAGNGTGELLLATATDAGPFTIGNITAFALSGRIGGNAATTGVIARSGDVTAGSLTLGGANSIGTTAALTVGDGGNGSIATGGNLTLRGDAGVVVRGQVSNLVDGAGGLSVSSGAGGVDLRGIDVAGAVDLTAAPGVAVTLRGAVGNLVAPAFLTTNGPATVVLTNGAVTTAGAQNYSGTLVLRADAVLTGAGATFAGGLNGAGGGADHDLTLNFTGSTTLTGAGLTGVRNLLTDSVGAPAGGTTLSGVIRTSGSQRYNDAVTLAGATTLTSTGTSGAGDIIFGAALGGTGALVVNTAGTTSFAQGATGLESIETDAPGAATLNGAFVTTGGQNFRDAVRLASDVTVRSTGGGAIGFGAAVAGAAALAVDTGGLATFGGLVGGAGPGDALTSFASTGAVRLNGGGVTTTGAQSYAGALSLGADAVLTGTTGTFSGGVAGGGRDLTLNFSAPTTIGGGSFSDVRNFASGGGGTTTLSGLIDTLGGQSYADDVVLAGDVMLRSGGGTGTGTIGFGGAVNGTGALTVTTGGSTRLGGAVAVGSLLVDGAGAVQLSGGTVTTTGGQRYAGAATLGADMALTTNGGDISFGGSVDGPFRLSARTGAGAIAAGNVTFGGAVGAGTALNGLAVRANAVTLTTGRVGTLAVAVNTGPVSFSDGGALSIGVVDGLTGISTPGAATIVAAGPLTLNAGVTANGVSLAGIGIAQAAGASVEAGAGAILLNGGGGAVTLGDRLTTANGGADAVRLLNAGAVQLGAIRTGAGGTVTLGGSGADALTGAVTQAAGSTISAGTLAGSVRGAVTLANANAIGTLGGFDANGFALRVTGGLDVTGTVAAGTGDLALTAEGGALNLGAGLRAASGTVALNAGGAVTQNGGAIVARVLTGSATGTASFSGADNAIGGLAGFTSGGGFTLRDTVALAITGDVINGGSLAITANGIDFAGRTLSGPGAVALNGGTGAVTGGTVRGVGLTVSGGGVGVDRADAGSGALLVTASDPGRSLTLGSAAAGTTATLTSAGALTVTGALTAGGDVAAQAGGVAKLGSVTSTAGAIGVTGTGVEVASATARNALLLRGIGGGVSLGTGAAGGDATLTATGAVALDTLGTAAAPVGGRLVVEAGLGASGNTAVATGPAAVTAGGPVRFGVLNGAGVTATGQSVEIGSATSTAALLLKASGGSLQLGTGTAADGVDLTATGGDARLGQIVAGAGNLTVSATGSVTGVNGGRADLSAGGTGGQVKVVAGANALLGTVRAADLLTVQAGTIDVLTASGSALTLNTTTGGLSLGAGTTGGAATLTAAGPLSVTGSLSAGAALSLTATGSATLGQLSAGAQSPIAIKAAALELKGAVTGAAVSLTNAAPASGTKLGDGTAAGGFSLSAAEVNNINAAQLTIDSGTGNVEIGALPFAAGAGRSRVDVMTTGRLDVTGAVSGSGAGRVFRFGGSATAGDLASGISVAATGDAGGRLLFDNADLELRGARIGVGMGTGFLDPLGLTAGNPVPVGTISGLFVTNPNSTLYNAALGGAAYPGGTVLVSARALTVRYSNYALFQNTGAPGQTGGVQLGSAASPNGVLSLQRPAGGANAFALFGTINGISGNSTSVLGPTVISVTGADLATSRINGCVVGSAAGCLSAVVTQPFLSVFDNSRVVVFRISEDLVLPFDPVVGTGNEALFAGLGLLDDGITGTGCTDAASPACAQLPELDK